MSDILEFMNSTAFIKTVILTGVAILLLIGLYGIMKKKNIIKIIMCIGIMETAVNIFFIALVYNTKDTAPLFTDGKSFETMADPIPQALVLTAIVIGVAVLALGLTLAVKYYNLTGRTNISKMNDLKR